MERHIEASATVRASTTLVRTILRETPESVLGDREVGDRGVGHRQFRSTVAAGLGSGTTVEQVISVDVGPVRVTNDGEYSAALSWQPVGHERSLPSFEGELLLEPEDANASRVTLRGAYEAPLGPVGRFGDAVVGRRLARRTLVAYVDSLSERFGREIVRRQQFSTRNPAPYNEDLRSRSRD